MSIQRDCICIETPYLMILCDHLSSLSSFYAEPDHWLNVAYCQISPNILYKSVITYCEKGKTESSSNLPVRYPHQGGSTY